MTNTDDRALAERVARACGWTVYDDGVMESPNFSECPYLHYTDALALREVCEHALRTFCKRHGMIYSIIHGFNADGSHQGFAVHVDRRVLVDYAPDDYGFRVEKMTRQSCNSEADIPRTICRAIAEAAEKVKGAGQ